MSRARKLLFADGIMPTKESYSAMRAAQKMRALLEEYMARENVPLAIALQELHDKGLLADLEYRQKRAMLTACAIREESEGGQERLAAAVQTEMKEVMSANPQLSARDAFIKATTTVCRRDPAAIRNYRLDSSEI